MKNLTFEEFQTRTQAVAKARKIFIKSGLTNNITYAFELYQEILAEEKQALTMSGKKPLPLDGTRLKCEKCGGGMGLGPVNTTPANQVEGEVYSQWYCENCDASVFNKATVQEIVMSVRKV